MDRSWITVVVAQKRIEAESICSFELVDAAHGLLPPFHAGAHIDVEISQDLVRQYSLCNHPEERHRYVIGVLREPQSRGGSAAMIDDVRVGDELRIGVPRNLFALAPESKHALLLAGGIGITPILSMAESLAFDRIPFRLIYANRSRARTAFLERIEASPYVGSAQLHFDDESGRTLDLRHSIGSFRADSHLYVCGPPGFINAVLEAADGNGWPSSAVHREYFQAPIGDAPPTRSFSVRIASTGDTYLVPAERSVAEVLAGHGIKIPTSCEQGVCGTCVTRVLEGIPEHHDMFLTEDEHAKNDQFTPCCSRSKTPLLLLDI